MPLLKAAHPSGKAAEVERLLKEIPRLERLLKEIAHEQYL